MIIYEWNLLSRKPSMLQPGMKNKLIGTVRILSDGYFFGTIPELMVDPEYQGQGIGKRLRELAWDASETSLFFGARPGKETIL